MNNRSYQHSSSPHRPRWPLLSSGKSGQHRLDIGSNSDPETMEIVAGGIEAEIASFANLQAIAEVAGGSLDNSVKFNISLTDLDNFQVVNGVMAEVFNEPYPARACAEAALQRRAGRDRSHSRYLITRFFNARFAKEHRFYEQLSPRLRECFA